MYLKKELYFAFVIIFSLFIQKSAFGAVKEERIDYTADGITMKGYMAYDDAIKGKKPGVLVVHEWWGQNDYTRKRARMLAELGYIAFAVDMYGNGKTAANPDEAKNLSGEVNKDFKTINSRFTAALDRLKKHPSVDPERISATGYCFGGGIVLNMARSGAPLKGVVSFHGSLDAKTPAKKGSVKSKMLVLHGADDKFVPPEQVDAFKKEMDAAGAKYKFVSYPGAVHAFTNPDADEFGKKFQMPIAYNEEADKKSWEEMKKFLEEVNK